MRKGWLGNGILLLAAAVWGFGFAAQDLAGQHLGAFSILTLRFLMGSLVLLPVIAVIDRAKGGERALLSKREGRWRVGFTKAELVGGAVCGAVVSLAALLQQVGISSETGDAAAASFITALYVIFVPILGLFLRRRVGANVWIGVGVAVLGFYLLTANIVFSDLSFGGILASFFVGFALSPSDILLLICAVLYAVHILAVDRFVDRVDGVRLSCIQFFVGFLLSLPMMLILERPSPEALLGGLWPVMYLGVISTGVGYTLQVVGQRYTDPAIAPVVLSLESVFGALGVALVTGEYKTPIQYVGCGAVLLAVIIAQLPARKIKTEAKKSKEAKEEM